MASKKKDVITVISSEIDFKARVMNDNDPKLYVVDVYSQWCGPCQQMGPTFKSLVLSVTSFDERLGFIQVERTFAKDFAGNYPATSRPLFLFIRQGAVLKAIQGCNAPEIIETINQLIPPLKDD